MNRNDGFQNHVLKGSPPPKQNMAQYCWWFRILHHLGCKKSSVNSAMNYQPQLVSRISEPSTVGANSLYFIFKLLVLWPDLCCISHFRQVFADDALTVVTSEDSGTQCGLCWTWIPMELDIPANLSQVRPPFPEVLTLEGTKKHIPPIINSKVPDW